jgi:LacI family repressor for deo operon, udp, cdd, tsx, nupC, and nupG
VKTITSKVNIIEVAQFADVSVATVSRVLNGSPRVKDETRQRVLDAVDRLGYVPNQLAANLRKLNTRVVLVVVPDIGNPFFSALVRAITSTMEVEGYTVFIADTQNSVSKEEYIIKHLRQREIDGAIFLTARIDAMTFAEVGRRTPLVLACETLPGVHIPQVGIDNVRAAFEATQFLLRLGHRHIAHIKGFEGMKLSFDREKGYIMAMDGAGQEPVVLPGDFSGLSGRTAARQIMTDYPDTTAIFAANDEMAMGCIAELVSRGRRVPTDISVMGFDDLALGELYTPGLTTVHQPKRQIGQVAAEQLLGRLRGREHEQGVQLLPFSIVERGSTSGPKED